MIGSKVKHDCQDTKWEKAKNTLYISISNVCILIKKEKSSATEQSDSTKTKEKEKAKKEQ